MADRLCRYGNQPGPMKTQQAWEHWPSHAEWYLQHGMTWDKVRLIGNSSIYNEMGMVYYMEKLQLRAKHPSIIYITKMINNLLWRYLQGSILFASNFDKIEADN